MKIATTRTERTTHSHTSETVSVKIEVEPKSVEQTSPERLDDEENKFIMRYPRARELTDSIAIAESPLRCSFSPPLIIATAQTTVQGRTRSISLLKLRIPATHIIPNAACERPSPIKENLFSTSVTPRSDEHKAINIPTMRAY